MATRLTGGRQATAFENLIQDFILNLGLGWTNNQVPGNMLFLGNPGDYAWGREGLDAIVTQLLNQMDGAGKNKKKYLLNYNNVYKKKIMI